MKPSDSTHPSFAVIGHPNKGKSSIVATLAEDDSIRVSPMPGTTRESRRFGLRVDGRLLYELVDTPGFQRARELLDWLQEHESPASQRAALVAQFVSSHESDPRFHDECELLGPLLEGAGILYVVDGAKPYGAEYELEMEVLRWTGRPRMALINLIGEGNYVEEWRAALGQYFSIVRVFDAVHADFDKRLDLLRGFAQLDEQWRAALDEAVQALLDERSRRLRTSAEEISGMLCEVLTASQSKAMPPAEQEDGQARQTLQAALTERLKDQIRRRESRCRRAVAEVYRHFQLNTVAAGAQERQDTVSSAASSGAVSRVLDAELFAEESWQLFGLSRQQLLVTGALSGAVAGGGVDLLLGGASLLLGAGIGAVLGGAGAWFGGDELAKVKVLGQRLGGKVLQVGPVKDLNFPWVLLGRAWLHHKLVSERNHARREAMAVDAALAAHHTDALPTNLKRGLARVFAKLASSSGVSSEQRAELTELVTQLLETDPDLQLLSEPKADR